MKIKKDLHKTHGILLTATVYPAISTAIAIKASSERIEQYKRAISHYRNIFPATPLIICDNSGYDFSPILDELCCDTFEALSYVIDEKMVRNHGKGYGEGHMIEYVLANSKLVSELFTLTKITGRLIVNNIGKIVESLSHPYWRFQRISLLCGGIDTRVFTFPVKDYMSILGGCYLDVNDDGGMFFEHVVTNRLFNSGLNWRNHDRYPDIRGVSGSTGGIYDEQWLKRLPKNILCYLNLYR